MWPLSSSHTVHVCTKTKKMYIITLSLTSVITGHNYESDLCNYLSGL